MGACATKPGDLKVNGEAPVVVEDVAADKIATPPVGETDAAADVSRRRSLSDLLKDNAESDGEEAPEAETKTEPAATGTDDQTGATEEQQPMVEPSVATTEHDTAEVREPKEAAQDPDAHAQVVEEEKRVDPDSVQQVAAVAVVAAESVEESKVADATM